MNPKEYWARIGAPKIRLRKRELGRAVSNTTIASAVESQSGKATSRQLVEEWMKGNREPYVSQLVALCDQMKISLTEVLQPAATVREQPLFQSGRGERRTIKSVAKTRARTA
jgi:hypothetical protein